VHNNLRVKWEAAAKDQERIFKHIIKTARKTRFAQDHQLDQVQTHADYIERVPIRDYEKLKSYFDAVVAGERDVLWPGKPKYLAKTSGTTSGAKYIPLTKLSAPTHIDAARTTLMNYTYAKGITEVWDGKMIFLSGSPTLDKSGAIPTGRLSGIVNHMVPSWLKPNQLPSYSTNCIEDWEEKLAKIVEETIGQDLRLISGIPPWMIMYFEQLLEQSGKEHILELFPNLKLLVHGGVNFRPYAGRMRELIGGDIDMVETYPASEGFIAFQHDPERDDLLLNTWSGMFYEFIPLDQAFDEHPDRLGLTQVQKDVPYAIVLTTTAGLWSYLLGDTVVFTGFEPYTIKVAGRVKHFISAFGEHVIGKEVEEAMINACSAHDAAIVEFTVAPRVEAADRLPGHEWYIEFGRRPKDLEAFTLALDQSLRAQNTYYDDLVSGSIIKPLEVYPVEEGTFQRYMKSVGRLGGQNKLPRLSNNRDIVDHLGEQ